MENFQGGDCLSQMGIHFVVGGMFGDPWGYLIGAVYGYYMSLECHK